MFSKGPSKTLAGAAAAALSLGAMQFSAPEARASDTRTYPVWDPATTAGQTGTIANEQYSIAAPLVGVADNLPSRLTITFQVADPSVLDGSPVYLRVCPTFLDIYRTLPNMIYEDFPVIHSNGIPISNGANGLFNVLGTIDLPPLEYHPEPCALLTLNYSVSFGNQPEPSGRSGGYVRNDRFSSIQRIPGVPAIACETVPSPGAFALLALGGLVAFGPRRRPSPE